MTARQYWRWVRKYKRRLNRDCRNCGVCKTSAGDICLICLDQHQAEVDVMKAQVKK